MNKPVKSDTPGARPFMSDIESLRRRARELIGEGARRKAHPAAHKQTIEVLQAALAGELVCVQRYTQHAIVAADLARDGAEAVFSEHARHEQAHAMMLAQRINQLGGEPDFNPDGLLTRLASRYTTAQDMVGMVRENLEAERYSIGRYHDLIEQLGERDPTTRAMLETILTDEEEHMGDMLELLTDQASG